MKKQDFYFDLPQELIAQYPLPKRCQSRLLVYHRQTQLHEHHTFNALTESLNPGDLLVMNNSKVIPARFFGVKNSGGRVEFLIERIQNDQSFLTHIKASKPPKVGMTLYLEQNWQVQIIEKYDDLYHCQVAGDVLQMLKDIGHIPLPPYITRKPEQLDVERYQTIYALYQGSVAVPAAGLHFDQTMLDLLSAKDIKIAYVTLHVGAGTFKPVRCDFLRDHKMHAEQCIVDEALCDAVNQARRTKKRVIAVGTTAMRSLESAAQNMTSNDDLKPYHCDTDIFIYPGYQFKICDGLLTNFHLPESTLLMLVSAFIGHTEAMALYQEAIAQKYRFFSYGDTSLLL